MSYYTHYYVVAGLSIIFLVASLLHLKENDVFSVKAIKRFRILFYVIMFATVLDAVFASLSGRDSSRELLYAIKVTEQLINLIIPYLVFDIFFNKKASRDDVRMKMIREVMFGLMGVNVILQGISVPTRCIFYIDEQNHYCRGDYIFIYVAMLFVMLMLLVFGIMQFSNKTQSTMKITLCSFVGILVIGIALRAFFTEYNYDYLCISVSTLLFLVYYSHITLRVDSLTHLLNRRVYQRMLERIDYTTLIVMIDANNFKSINDTYGHECGDRTLKKIADIICKTLGRYAYCFRLGGDEFCAILKSDVFERLVEATPYCDVYTMADNLTKSLDAAIVAECERDKSKQYCLAFGVSQGYGVYYPPDNYGDKRKMPIEEVVELADKQMYRNKELFQKTHSEDSIPKPEVDRARVLYQVSSPVLMDDNKKSE